MEVKCHKCNGTGFDTSPVYCGSPIIKNDEEICCEIPRPSEETCKYCLGVGVIDYDEV